MSARKGAQLTTRSALENAIADAKRLDYLERLFKQNRRYYDRVAIQTLPMSMQISAINKHHGDEAGLHQAATLREAIDKAMQGKK